MSAANENRRWIIPLEKFLGDQEPDDDDREDWIIRNIVPRGEPALIAGPPKSGKTYLALDLALSIATGTSWLGPDFENTLGPARVLVLAYEDAVRRLRKRVWHLSRGRGYHPNDPLLQQNLSIGREPLRLPDDNHEKALIAELRVWRPAAVIVDNLTRVMQGDANKTQDASRFTTAWSKICGDAGVSLVLLHHTAKDGAQPGKRDPFDAIRGSGDFVAAARNIVVTRPMPESEGAKVASLCIRGNLDLTRDTLALGFVQGEERGRPFVRLVDQGDPKVVAVDAWNERQRAKLLELASHEVFPTKTALAMKAGGNKAKTLRLIDDLLDNTKELEYRGGGIAAAARVAA